MKHIKNITMRWPVYMRIKAIWFNDVDLSMYYVSNCNWSSNITGLDPMTISIY